MTPTFYELAAWLIIPSFIVLFLCMCVVMVICFQHYCCNSHESLLTNNDFELPMFEDESTKQGNVFERALITKTI